MGAKHQSDEAAGRLTAAVQESQESPTKETKKAVVTEEGADLILTGEKIGEGGVSDSGLTQPAHFEIFSGGGIANLAGAGGTQTLLETHNAFSLLASTPHRRTRGQRRRRPHHPRKVCWRNRQCEACRRISTRP